MSRMTVLAACALLASPAAAGAAELTVPEPTSVTASGRIRTLDRVGDRIYVRGDFESIGRFVGSLVALDPASGARDPGFPSFDGQISDVVDDGAGGVFVGGDFTRVNGVSHRGLVHLRADRSVDPVFRADIDDYGKVYALARDGVTLYVGGSFDSVNGTERQDLAAVRTATGATRPFAATLGDAAVRELAALPATPTRGGRLYVGTSAAYGGPEPKPATLLALDPGTGSPVPGFASAIRADVRALLATDGAVWAGGAFGLDALDPDTGARVPGADPTPRDAGGEPVFRGTVHELLLDGGRLLAGGEFAELGGAPGPLVALDPATGRAVPGFSAPIRPTRERLGSEPPRTFSDDDAGIFTLARIGGRLWAGGRFAAVGNRPATGLAALDPATGAPLDVTPPALDGQVNAITALGGRVLVGGQFATPAALRRDGFAALDARTLEPIARFAPPDLPRDGVPLTAGAGRLFLVRDRFPDYGRDPKRRFARTTDAIRALDPATGASRGRLDVIRLTGIAVLGDRLFVARRLDDDRRFPRVVVDVRSARTLKRLRSFRLPLPGYVTRLAAVDGKLYAAGSFRRTRPSGQRANIALLRLDPRTGRLDARFDPHVTGPVHEVARGGDALYLAGVFRRVGGSRRPSDGLAAVTVRTGALRRGFAPELDGGVDAALTPVPGALLLQSPFANRLIGLGSGRALRRDVTGLGADAGPVVPGLGRTIVVGGALRGRARGQSGSLVDVVRLSEG